MQLQALTIAEDSNELIQIQNAFDRIFATPLPTTADEIEDALTARSRSIYEVISKHKDILKRHGVLKGYFLETYLYWKNRENG